MSSWDERLFGWIYRSTNAVFRRSGTRLPSENEILLGEMSHRLELFASMLGGDVAKVRAAENVGGYRGSVILLPKTMNLFSTREANEKAYLFRTAYSVASRRLGFTSPSTSAWVTYLSSALCVPETLNAMKRDWTAGMDAATTLFFDDRSQSVANSDWMRCLLSLTGARAPNDEILGRISAAIDEYGDISSSDIASSIAEKIVVSLRLKDKHVPSPPPLIGVLMPTMDIGVGTHDEAPTPQSRPTTTKEAKQKDFVRRRELPEEPEAENPLVHSFEKVHTADEYAGGNKRIDGEDELAQHSTALDDLDLRDVVRSSKTVGSLYRADVLINAEQTMSEADEPKGEYSYDEWDEKSGAYRRDHCQLFEERDGTTAIRVETRRWLAEVVSTRHAEIQQLRSEIQRVQDQQRPISRQQDGPEVDIDALINEYATYRAGRTPDTRVHIQERRHSPDVAALILLDCSLSSDSYNEGERILDVARESLVVFAEAMRSMDQQVAIAAFFGNTRRNCRFVFIKDFDEDWEQSWQRLSDLSPTGYTRIGPAIRHAGTLLNQTHAKRQVLVVLSDAKPTDYDGYEGRYGAMDVHHAIAECKADRISTFGLVLEKKKRAHHAMMFGRGGYALLPRANQSASALTRLFTHWLHP